MSCQCFQIGGPFIAEDPDCPAHGREAQEESVRRDKLIQRLERALEQDDDVYRVAEEALDYLRSL